MSSASNSRQVRVWLIELAILVAGLLAAFGLPMPFNFLIPVALVGLAYLHSAWTYLGQPLKPHHH